MRRVLWILTLVAAVAALVVFGQRWMVEVPNRTVELVYDLPGLLQLSQESGVPASSYLEDLRKLGLKTIAIQPESLGERMLSGGEVPADVKEHLPDDLSELGKFITLPLSFAEDHFSLVQAAGLQAAPKLNTVPWEVAPLWLAAAPELLILSGQGVMEREQLQGSQAVLALVEFSAPALEEADHSHGSGYTVSARGMKLSDQRIINPVY